jgi:hypothetical protein
MLSLTPNDEVNSLAALNFSKIFGSNQVYQLPSQNKKKEEKNHVARDLKGKILFGNNYNFQHLNNRINDGYTIKSSKITEKYSYEDLIKHYGEDEIIPLFIIDDGSLLPVAVETELGIKRGNTVISLLKEK